MKFCHPTSIKIDRGMMGQTILGASGNYFSPSNYTFTITLVNDDEIEYLMKRMNNKQILEEMFIGNYLIKDMNISRIDRQNGVTTVEFISGDITFDPLIKFDVRDKNDITLKSSQYYQFQKYYGKPEKMYYNEFYTNLAAIEI